MARSILSVLAGVFTSMLLVNLASVVLYAAVPDLRAAFERKQVPGPGWVALNLLLSLAFASAAGWVTATLARRAEMKHAGALAALITVLNLITLATGKGFPPAWWTAAEGAVGVAGVLLGGWLRAR